MQSTPKERCLQGSSGMQSGLQSRVEIIVNEKTYIKLKINPTENLEHHIIDLRSKNYFPRYQYQISYLVKFSKYVNGEERVFHKGGKSDLKCNHSNEDHTIHNNLMEKLDDAQLEGSDVVFREIKEVIKQIYKVMILKHLHGLYYKNNIRIKYQF